MVWEPIAPVFEAPAMVQSARHRQSPTLFLPMTGAITMFGREELRPVMEGITIGIEALLFMIGAMTLGIGGVGVMTISSSPSRARREIGLRRALARAKNIFAGNFY